MKKWFIWIFGITGGLILAALIAMWVSSDPKPEGKVGPAADQLAQKMMEAVNIAAWDTTDAISWVFNGTARHEHLWDKKRHYAQVVWPDHKVLVDINQKSGVAYVKGSEVKGEQGAQLVETAWQYWVNDAFWLNPVVKAFDGGTTRELVELENGKEALLVSYGAGGVTPGDAYLWELAEDGRPTAWRMWVKIIPVGGMRFSWEGWQQLSTGAWVATRHQTKAMDLQIGEVQGAATLAELVPDADPFAALEGK